MKRIVTVLACVWSLSSWAQDAFVISTALDNTQSSYFFAPGGCADTVTLRWTYAQAVAVTPNDSLQLWASSLESCGDVPENEAKLLTTVSWPVVASTRSGSFDVRLSDLPMFDGGACPASSSTTLICGAMPYLYSGTVGGTTKYAKGTGFIVFDPDPPAAPVITDAIAKDRGIDVDFVAPSDASLVALEVRAPSAADFQRVTSSSASEPKVTAAGLVNGVEYRVRLVAIDVAGNESTPSNEVTATPVAPEVDAGVPDDGDEPKRGCTTAPGLFVALAALWLRRRPFSSR